MRLRVALDGFGVAFGVGSAVTRSQINCRDVRLKCSCLEQLHIPFVWRCNVDARLRACDCHHQLFGLLETSEWDAYPEMA